MFVLRSLTAAAVAAAGLAALAGTAPAKISGNAGSFIAFEHGGDIHVMSEDGVGVFDVDLTNSAGTAESAPSWGPPEHNCLRPGGGDVDLAGGRTLVYESRPGGGGSDIVLAKLSGNPPAIVSTTNLTAASGEDDGAPAVGRITDAPTQQAVDVVVFTRGRIGHRHIWAMFLDGSHQTQLTHGANDEFSPDWSSGGGILENGFEAAESIVYQTADAAGRQQLAVIRVGYNSEVPDQLGVVALSDPRFITSGSEQHGDPSWYGTSISDAADPSRIVHVSTAAGTTYLDFLEQRSSSGGEPFAPTSVPSPLVHQLTGDPGGDFAPSWRPEGDSVVFDSDRAQPGNRDIYRIKADGTGLVRLTRDLAADRTPDWESIGGGCLNPEPYGPRPGTQTRNGPRPKSRPSTGQTTLRVTNLRTTRSYRGNRRTITVRFVVNVPARGTLRLRRGNRTIASKNDKPLRAGKATIRLKVPRSAPGGRYKLRLTVTAGSTARSFNRSVKIRSLRSRR